MGVYTPSPASRMNRDPPAKPILYAGAAPSRIDGLVRATALLPLHAQCRLCVPFSAASLLEPVPNLAKNPSSPSTRSGCTPRCHTIRSLVAAERVSNPQTLRWEHQGPSPTCR